MHIEVEKSMGKNWERCSTPKGRCCRVTPVKLSDRALAGIKRQAEVLFEGAKNVVGIHCGRILRTCFFIHFVI